MCINGKKLAEAREKAGLSQAKLARELGISQGTIRNYENGITNPTDETVDRICFVLKIDKENIEIHEVGYDFLNNTSKTIDKIRQRKGFVRYSTPKETEEWIEKRRSSISDEEEKEIETAFENSISFGSKKYILIDPRFIHVPDWQRDTDMAKATEIAENFNEDKYDPVKVYVAPDGKLIVADGAHRLVGFILKGKFKILVEVLNCNENEAILTFLDQQSGRKTMTVCDMYRAGVKANIKEYIHFKELFEDFNIQITAEEGIIENPIGFIKPSSAVFRMVENDTETLVKTIELIRKLEWTGSEKNAFTCRNFFVIKRLFANYGNNNVENKLMKNCKGAVYYESKVVPVKSNAELFDLLSAEMWK